MHLRQRTNDRFAPFVFRCYCYTSGLRKRLTSVQLTSSGKRNSLSGSPAGFTKPKSVLPHNEHNAALAAFRNDAGCPSSIMVSANSCPTLGSDVSRQQSPRTIIAPTRTTRSLSFKAMSLMIAVQSSVGFRSQYKDRTCRAARRTFFSGCLRNAAALRLLSVILSQYDPARSRNRSTFCSCRTAIRFFARSSRLRRLSSSISIATFHRVLQPSAQLPPSLCENRPEGTRAFPQFRKHHPQSSRSPHLRRGFRRRRMRSNCLSSLSLKLLVAKRSAGAFMGADGFDLFFRGGAARGIDADRCQAATLHFPRRWAVNSVCDRRTAITKERLLWTVPRTEYAVRYPRCYHSCQTSHGVILSDSGEAVNICLAPVELPTKTVTRALAPMRRWKTGPHAAIRGGRLGVVFQFRQYERLGGDCQ